MNSRIIVAGGGASGLMAALTAKEQGADDVLILERGGEIGKKILSTGSGRCNLTNENQSPDCYHSSLPGSFLPVLSQLSKEDTVRFFEENGLHLKAKNGYYYPRNAQALSVRDFLRDCCRKAGVRVELNKKITGVTVRGKGNGRREHPAPANDAKDVPEKLQDAVRREHSVPANNAGRQELFVAANDEGSARNVDRAASRRECRQSGEKGNVAEIAGFRVACEDGSLYDCDRLILAGGGKAAPQTGSDGSMYAIARRLGHTLLAPVPALTPLCVKKEELKFFQTAGGARADGRITLFFGEEERSRKWSDTEKRIPDVRGGSRNAGEGITLGNRICELSGTVTDCGEIQFVDYGLSGIPVFNVSAAAGRAWVAVDAEVGGSDPIPAAAVRKPGGKAQPAKHERTNRGGTEPGLEAGGACVRAEVDFLPEISSELLKVQFYSYRERCPEDTFRMWLRGYLPTKLAEAILARAGVPPALYLRKCSGTEAESLFKTLKGSSFALAGTGPFEKAQTTSGGIDMREVNLETLESKLVPGLFFAGEILDVDGICGGYNLQWAWSSGFAAGKAAAGKAGFPKHLDSFPAG